MDRRRHLWRAKLDGANLVAGQPITQQGSPIDLGDVDAYWKIRSPGQAGDNSLLCDDYRLSTFAAEPLLELHPVAAPAHGQLLLRLTREKVSFNGRPDSGQRGLSAPVSPHYT
jgi:hypothetical protein